MSCQVPRRYTRDRNRTGYATMKILIAQFQYAQFQLEAFILARRMPSKLAELTRPMHHALQDAKAKVKAEKAAKAKKKEQERLIQAKAKEDGDAGDSKKAKLKKEAEAKKVCGNPIGAKLLCIFQRLTASSMLGWLQIAYNPPL